jgi:aspartate/methionine/tyrosine aminotransferase
VSTLPRLAARVDAIEPFQVMEMAKAAQQVAASPACDAALGGEPMIYLNIGEPDFAATTPVLDAARHAVDAGRLPYTQATGLPALRRAIAGWYGTRFGLDVDPARIVVTAGASGALQLLCLALFETGDEVLMPDPCYPCNRHFVTAAGGRARLLPTSAAQRFQLDAAMVREAWTPATRGVLLASPSNPTGTSIDPAEMRAIAETVRARGGVTIVDEIYLGLSYDARYGQSALAHGSGHGDDVISVNSFSKYFAMTGWRLGWLVLPPALVAPVEKLAQNLFICPSTLAQQAALACFEPASIEACEQRRGEFERRRDVSVEGLQRIGLTVPVVPDGAFYAWADCSAFATDSWDLCHQLLHTAHVALTPGRDFGPTGAARHLRLSFASALPQLREALARLERALHR